MRLASLLLLASPAAAQTTWYVDASASAPGNGTLSDPYASIQTAIAASATVDGDTIQVAQGVYVEQLDLLGKAIVVEGDASTAAPVVDGGLAGPTVTMNSGEGTATVLRHLVITGGSGTNQGGELVGGGALLMGVSPLLQHVTFDGNGADLGGGVWISGGAPRLEDCDWLSNEAQRGGGLYATGGADLDIVRSVFRDNRADPQTMQGQGGGIYVDDASLRIAHSDFEENLTFNIGGGAAIACFGLVDVSSSRFVDNDAGASKGGGGGGAIYDPDDGLIAHRCSFERNGRSVNTVPVQGGAAFGGAYFDCRFVSNASQVGGALHAATATGCYFSLNDACEDGSGQGGAANSSTLIECVLERNRACGAGGGAYGSLLTDCVVIENWAIPTDTSFNGRGGGISNCTATGTLLERNRAVRYVDPEFGSRGGGAHESTLERCVIAGNDADFGGGVWRSDTTHCSIIGNSAFMEFGGVGGFSDHSSTVVWHNVPSTVGNLSSFEYSNVEGAAAGVGNLNLDPLVFGPAGSDAHLEAGSPCIDTGNPLSPLDPDGSRADMGALPYSPGWTPGPGKYCTTATASRLEVDGSASASGADQLTIIATGVPANTFGLFFLGADPAPTSPVAGDPLRGAVCIGGQLLRLPVQTATEEPATMTQVIGPSELGAAGLVPGDRVYVQCWYRYFGSTAALTDAVEAPIVF